jgi:threo-3-hydroxy-L-aspartate ammonia-lyase
MRFAFDRLKLVMEPSGATGLAALLAGRLAGLTAGRPDAAPPRIGVIVSGGNVDARRFAELLA